MYTNKYKNKYISILGDSISTFEGYSEPRDAAYYNLERKLVSNVLTLSDTWWGQVVEALGAKLLVNNSISGSTVTWHPSYEIQSYGCSNERTSSLGKDGISPDVIIVYLGTNDWGSGIQPSARKNNDNNCELTIFSTAYCKMLEKLRVNYPKSEIWCVTLAISCFSNSKTFEFPYFSGGWHISEYCENIRTCASKYNCKIIDLYNNAEPYDTLDGFHPNKRGMSVIARTILESL